MKFQLFLMSLRNITVDIILNKQILNNSELIKLVSIYLQIAVTGSIPNSQRLTIKPGLQWGQ